jgi:hypothetical protein
VPDSCIRGNDLILNYKPPGLCRKNESSIDCAEEECMASWPENLAPSQSSVEEARLINSKV